MNMRDWRTIRLTVLLLAGLWLGAGVTQASSRHSCGRVRNAPPGYPTSSANEIRATHVPCSRARVVVRGWLGKVTKHRVSHYRGWRFKYRTHQGDYLASRRQARIRFWLVSADE